MFFEANQGQTDRRVKFLSRGHGYGLFLTADEAVLSLNVEPRLAAPAAASARTAPAGNVIRMRLDGANPAAQVSGTELLPGKSNYFIGHDPAKWHRGIPQYARVNYASVYPGIDLTYYGNQGELEYDFRVAPGADPSQIALKFNGAAPRIEAGELVLSTNHGDVRFHAPRIYQRDGVKQTAVDGSFRQLAGNRIGFQVGNYDRNQDLIIDPILSYSTYFGGTKIESLTQIAVDSGLNMYVATSTTSAGFPVTDSSSLTGAQNLLVAKINPAGNALVFATYLGGNGIDQSAGIAVDTNASIYVAGTTTSTNFPTTTNAFQVGPQTGTHGFVSKFSLSGSVYVLSYSTYLAGNAADTVTGLAVFKNQFAYVTGTTTSTNSVSGFPSTANAYQPCPFRPGTTCDVASGPPQFFGSKINTTGTGTASMLYSTYFGGDNPGTAQSLGGGIAVDASGLMFFTGSTNTFGVTGPNGEFPFPLLNAQQSCLNEAGLTSNCAANPPTSQDAILVRINPGLTGGASLVYSTFLGGSSDDFGRAVAVDGSGFAYVTGETFSVPWNLSSSFQAAYGGAGDAFIAKVTNPTGSNTVFPLSFFTYIGGSAEDFGTAIAVDAIQAAHVTGSTSSANLPVTSQNNLPPFGGNTDAFVALISTSTAAGNYLGFLGGSNLDQGTSIAIDPNLDSSPTFVAGITQSGKFPQNPAQPPFQGSLSGTQDAFIARIGSRSGFVLDPDPPTVNPSPATVGNPVTFTFEFTNSGPDPASNVIFSGALPSSGFTFSSASSTPGGTCPSPVLSKVTCTIGTVASGSTATVSVVLIPLAGTSSLSVVPSLSANGEAFVAFTQGTVQINDFSIKVDPPSATVTAGESTSFVVTLSPIPPPNATYPNTITVGQTGLPTGATGTFTSTSLTIPGTTPVTTTLNISTTARPVNTGSLLRGGPLYATWLPVGGLSLLGLSVGASKKRRRWLAGMTLGLLAGLILLQAACGGSSSSTPTTGGTPAGTYILKISGASGTSNHTQNVTLIVN